MRKILFALGLLSCSSQLFAQSTITGANFNPVAGETITLNLGMDSLSTTGPNGSNQTWNFQSIAGNPTMPMTSQYIPAQGTPRGSYYMANICIHSCSGCDYSYYQADTYGLRYLGNCSSTGSNGTSVSNSTFDFIYPITATTNYTNSINETETDIAMGYHDNTTGVLHLQTVGSGTLILPTGTYKNVLKVVKTRIDTTTYNGSIAQTSKRVSTMWLYPGIHTPILSNDVSVVIQTGSSPNYGASYSVTDAKPLALNDIVKNNYKFACYPNPAQNIVNLKFNLNEDAAVTINICSVKGDVVYSVNKGIISKGDNVNLPVDISMLAAGVYMVDANFSGVHVYQQIIKQ